MSSESDSIKSKSASEIPSVQDDSPEISNKKDKIIFIWLEGMKNPGPEKIDAMQRKHEQAGRKFTRVKYKKDGTFEPEIPLIDDDTKVIVFGHGNSNRNFLSSGGEKPVKLDHQTLAKELAAKSSNPQSIRVALYGCLSGVGKSRTNHETSMVGKLFKALQDEGCSPVISANLSPITFTDEGRTLKAIDYKSNPLWHTYHKKLKGNKDLVPGWTKLRLDYSIPDSKAQGSKVVLSAQPNSDKPEVKYPYGEPGNGIDEEKLHQAGKQGMVYKKKFDKKFSKRYQNLHQQINSDFQSLEDEHEGLSKNKNYKQLKEFLTTEYFIPEEDAVKNLVNEKLIKIAKGNDERYGLSDEKINDFCEKLSSIPELNNRFVSRKEIAKAQGDGQLFSFAINSGASKDDKEFLGIDGVNFDSLIARLENEGNSEQILKEYSSKLPYLIKDYSNLEDILGATSEENHHLIFEAIKKSMPGIIKDLDALRFILAATSSENHSLIFEACMPSIINDSLRILEESLYEISDENHPLIFEAVKENMPSIIKNKSDMEKIFKATSIEHHHLISTNLPSVEPKEAAQDSGSLRNSQEDLRNPDIDKNRNFTPEQIANDGISKSSEPKEVKARSKTGADVLPKQEIPVKNGEKYVCVGMSHRNKSDTHHWAYADFNKGYSGIYTDQLTSCAALTIIKRNQDNTIEKAWMIHMGGGVDANQFPDFPEQFDANYEVIVRYGEDEKNIDDDKIQDHTKSLMDKYKVKGLKENQINFFKQPEIAPLGIKCSFAVHKNGRIGFKHSTQESPGVDRITVQTVTVTSTVKKNILTDIHKLGESPLKKEEYKQKIRDNVSLLSDHRHTSFSPINQLKNRAAGIDANSTTSIRRLLRDINNNNHLEPEEKKELIKEIQPPNRSIASSDVNKDFIKLFQTKNMDEDLKTFIELCASLENDYKFINLPTGKVGRGLNELENKQSNEEDNTRTQSVALIIKLIATPRNSEKQFGDTDAMRQLIDKYNDKSNEVPASIKNEIQSILGAEPGQLQLKNIHGNQPELEKVTIDKIRTEQDANLALR